MTILSTIGQSINSWISGWTKTFEQGPSPAQTKLLNEVLAFAAGFPYAQFMGAAIVEGTNIPLDEATAVAIFADAMKSFFSGQSGQAATASVAAKIGISPAIAAQIIYAPDPVHPVDPTQYSRGR